jgi:hypothetical protein
MPQPRRTPAEEPDSADEPLRDAPVRNTFMTKAQATRKPLEKSKLSMAAKKDQARARRRAPADNSSFYTNIWAPEPEDDTPAPPAPCYIDISQVAYVLTTIDYKDGYEGPTGEALVNLWASPESVAAGKTYRRPPPFTAGSAYASVVISSRAAASLQPRQLSDVSVVISEHDSEEDEDDDTGYAAGTWNPRSVLSYAKYTQSAAPRTTGSKRVTFLQRQLSEENLSRVASIPISGPQRMGERVVFSTVLAKHEVVDMSWNSQFLLGLHEPVRHALFVIDRFLERSQEADVDWNVSEFFHWFKEHFVEFVRNQHHVKTAVLLPLVAVKFTDKREIAACYESIFVLLDEIMVQEAKLVSVASSDQSWQDHLQILQGDIRRLNFLLFNVLTLEEETLKPAIGESFTEQTFQRYVMPRVIRHSRPKRVVIPWIVERSRVWGGDKVAHAYRDELPFTARFMYDHAWQPYFVSHIASAMKNLGRDMVDVVVDETNESWLGCSIQ